MAKTRPCPCGLPKTYQECCGPLHRGRARATTAEQLMRSRFSAFALRDAAYLLTSWHPATRPPSVDFDRDLRWDRLEIVRTQDGTPFHDRGVVEFRAHFTQNGQPGELHEVSRFTRHEGAWVYLDGTTD
ncbi:YchJ family protein [Spirillospora sp. CA-253888]